MRKSKNIFSAKYTLAFAVMAFGLFVSHDAHAFPIPAVPAPIVNFIQGLFDGVVNIASTVLGAAFSTVTSALTTAINSIFNAIFGATSCAGSNAGKTLGGVICQVLISSETLPGFITALGYFLGLIMVLTALMKLKDHVLDPNRTPISDSVKRFIAAGSLFSLPAVTEAVQNLVTNDLTTTLAVSGYSGKATGGGGLDSMLVALFLDTFAPMMSLLYAFGYMAGLVLTFIGITRLIKTAQDGPRGPASLGTIMTFIVAGVLFSSGTLVEAFSASMFGDSTVATYATLQTSSGDAAVDDHIKAVISTVLVFMTIVGWISFLRGVFILRDVAEGSGQASLMASLTHIFGGALAVNLGPLMNAVQSTFGLTGFGVVFN